MSLSIKAAVLASGMHFSTVGSAFVRNVIFARLLSPEDFGVAMTFGVVLLLVEYTSNFGHESLLLRSDKGNLRGFQATMHSSLILRGIFVAAVILMAAPYISTFFRLPQDTFNYAWLAVVPFIRGFTHLDCIRFQREQNFAPLTKIVLLADGASVIVALICAYSIDSYWAFYISFVFRHSVGTIFTHLIATRAYQLRLYRKYLAELLSFGAPLILVGMIKYLGGESDKALIARSAGLELFTSYLLTLMLISNGFNLVSSAFSKIFIRRISKEKTREEQREAYQSNGVVTLYLLLPIALFMCVFAESIITIVFGMAYHPVQFLIPIICCLTILRSLNHWLNQIVVATCNTRILIAADLVRLSGLGMAILLANFTTDLRLFCAAFCLGELLYFLFLSIYLNAVNRRFLKFANSMISIALIGMVFVAGLYQVLELQPVTLKLIVTITVFVIFTYASCRLSKVCMDVSQKLIQYLKSLLTSFRLYLSTKAF